MKKLRSHSSAVLSAILLLAAVFVGCNDADERIKIMRSSEKVNGYLIGVIEYDSCQYLISGNGSSQMITHKGNCKFCAARLNLNAVKNLQNGH